jgi:hypothetical protein
MNEIQIKVINDENLKKVNIYGIDHFYYEFNQDKFENQIILLMNINEHWNNLELFKFYLWCKKNKVRVVSYGHLNELPLLSLFSDAVILFPSQKESHLYSGGSVYSFDDQLLSRIILQEILVPGALSFLDIRRWEINPELLEKFDRSHFEGAYGENYFGRPEEYLTGHVIELSKGYQNNSIKPYHILLDIAMRSISDEEVVDYFSFPSIWIRSSSLKIWERIKDDEFIKSEFPENCVMCEVKQQDSCGGKHLLGILHESTKDHPLKFVSDWEKKQKMFEMTGQDNYMEIQILGSFFYNWMWISYGGSAHIFSLLPLKVLSLSDQGVFYDLARKISTARFGDFGNTFPDCVTLIYCMPGEKDGPSRTDGHPPLPNFQKLVKDFSEYNFKFNLCQEKKYLPNFQKEKNT